MRIGLFTDAYYPKVGGVSTSVLSLKDNLEAQGHVVYVFTTTAPGAPDIEHNVFRIPSIPFRTQRLGTFVSPRFYQAAKRLPIDLIHTHTEYTLGILGRYLARELQIPFVHTMHTIYEYYTDYVIKSDRLEPAAKAVARRLTASFCNSADTVIVPTGKIKDLVLSYGVCRDIEIIPSGIPLDKFDAARRDDKKLSSIRAQLGLAETDRVILNIGRVGVEKHLDEILRIMQSYLPQRPGVKLVIVGDGIAKASLVAMAAELGIENQIVFAGERPWDEINLYYMLGDVFVGASESETQGLTYIEAMASGLPVVAKEDRCLDSVLTHGENGYFYKAPEDFTWALDNILFDDSTMRRLSMGAEETAKRFSATNYADSMSRLYAGLAAERGKYKVAL